jgi:hypothetical protein
VVSHPFFRLAASRLPADCVLQHLAALYVARSADLWKPEEALELLYEGAREVMREVDEGGWVSGGSVSRSAFALL